MEVSEQRYDLGHGRHLAAKHWGNPELPVLLCFHGWLDNAASFDLVAPGLARDFYVISVDMVGHGASDHIPLSAHYYVWEGVEDIVRLLDVLGIDVANIVGHSLGGAVSSLFAGAFPKRVRKLSMIEAVGPLAMDDQNIPAFLAAGIADRISRGDQRRIFTDIDAIVAAKMKVNGLSEAQAKAIVDRNLEHVKGGYCWRSDPRLRQASLWRVSESQISAFYARISVPVQLILGTESMFSQELVKKRVKAIKQLEVVTLPGHHHLHSEPGTALAVVDALRAFLIKL